MSYEIPQQLRYKERIIFGLTFDQLLYATVFGLAAWLLFAKTPFGIAVRIVLALVPASIAPLFMYCDLQGRIRDGLAFLQFRRATLSDKAMKRFLKLNAIENDCYYVQTRQGEKRVAVLMVEPLNFKIKPKDERDSIIYAFQKFLNALDFPVQVLMYTDDLNLDKYLRELEWRTRKTAEATGNPRYRGLFHSHKAYLDGIMRERLAVNRRFFIAVQENQAGLDTQLNIIHELLKGLNLKAVRLGGRQLIKVLIRFFNNPRGRSQLLAKEKTLYNIISPEEIVNAPDHIKVNQLYNRVIAASGYPRTVEEGFLDKIVTAAGNFDVSIHIEPFPIETTLVTLNKELQKQRADLYAAELKHQFQPSLEIQYKDTKAVLDAIQKGEERLFHVSFYINVKAPTLEELDLQTRTIQSHLNSILIIPKVQRFRMAQGLKSVLPFGVNELGVRRNITTHALSAFFPFTSPFLILEKGGVFLGLNKNKLPIIKDIFALTNANGAILATSGSGKSYTAKLLISRYLMNGTKVITIDPQGEYAKLTEKYGGSVVTISRDSETIINPLDLLGHAYADKRLALMDLFRIMFGDLTEIQKAILDRALSKTYSRHGITADDYRGKTPPTLSDLRVELLRMSRDATVFERGTYTALLNRLSMYVDGVFSFLNRQTKINVDNQFVTFNIGHMPKQVKPVMMFLILDYVYTKMKQDKERKLLVVDEAWSLLSRAEEESYIFEIVKTCRKFNLGLLLITQDVADLLNSKAGRAVLANSSYNILLRQKPAIINSIQDTFQLSYAEREHLLTAGVGEGLLMMENDHQELKIIASPQEHELITTKPDELLALEQNIPPETPPATRKMLINLDLSKGFYKKSALEPEEIDYLRQNEYAEHSLVPLRSRAHAVFLVKQVSNHTPDHTFLVHAIAEELLHFTDKVRISESSRHDDINPDIIFTDADGNEWAIEVETGVNLKVNRKYLEQKARLLTQTYGTRWRFILTSAHWRNRYTTAFGDVILLRHHALPFLKRRFAWRSRAQDSIPARSRTKNIDDEARRVQRRKKSFSRQKRR
jgi:ABC-type dipeptide/oligopeptide/nickel transport system ATPase subunit